MPNKRTDVTNHIIQGIKDQCNQIQVNDGIILYNKHAFQCPTYPKETVVYSAQIHGNKLTNTSILVSCLDKWIQLNKTRGIVVYEFELKINKECTKVVDDINSSLDCQKPIEYTEKTGKSYDFKGMTIGFGSSLLITIIIIIIIIIICIIKAVLW